MKASEILSFVSDEGGFVSFEKRDGKLIVRAIREGHVLVTGTIPGEAVEKLARFDPERAHAA